MAPGPDWLRRHPVATALVVVTALSLALRLYDLGGRVAHFDEARVGVWTLWYLEHGFWEYRPIVHGPFLFHVNEAVFGLLGASDWSMRLVVALVGGLAPLSAWLYRDVLDDIEVIAVGGFLAVTPLLLYYGRFSRNDVLLAVAMVVGLGLVLRAVATRRPGYLLPAGIALALGFTMKENAVLYLACWGGAGVAVLAHRLAYDRVAPRLGREVDPWRPREHLGSLRRLDRSWLHHGLLGSLAALITLVGFYAPRGGHTAGIDDLVFPWRWPAIIDASVIEAGRSLYDHWVLTHSRGSDLSRTYLQDLEFYLDVVAEGALVVALLAILGLVIQYQRSDGPRWFVLFAAVWAALSLGGYPYASGTPWDSAWIAVHIVVPLVFVAAVGVGLLVDLLRESLAEDDLVSVVGACLILLAAVSLLLWPAYGLVFVDHSGADNRLVQGAQPEQTWERPVADIHALLAATDGELDVLYYGPDFDLEDESIPEYVPGFEPWLDRSPMQWYTMAANATVESTLLEDEFDAIIADSDPPIVIATDTYHSSIAEDALDGYDRYEVDRRWGAPTMHMYLDLDRLDEER